jgi:uncharacterized protein
VASRTLRGLVTVVVASSLLAGCDDGSRSSGGRQAFGTFGEGTFLIERADGSRSKRCCGLIADGDLERQRGMRQRDSFGGYDGMVFVYEQDHTTTFTMSTVKLPLSIAWFAADGTFIAATEMAPCPSGEGCPTYPSPPAFRYALEVAGPGGLAALGAGPGARLVLLDEECPEA